MLQGNTDPPQIAIVMVANARVSIYDQHHIEACAACDLAVGLECTPNQQADAPVRPLPRPPLILDSVKAHHPPGKPLAHLNLVMQPQGVGWPACRSWSLPDLPNAD